MENKFCKNNGLYRKLQKRKRAWAVRKSCLCPFCRREKQNFEEVMTVAMTEEQKKSVCEKYGSMEAYRQSFLKDAGSEQAQKNFQKVVEWYGDKESAMEAGTNPKNPEIFSAYQNRMEQIMKRLAEKKGTDVSSFEVKSLMGEYDFVAKQLYQMKDVSKMALELAELYRKDEQMIYVQDAQYGEGASVYIADAIRAFYEA